MVSSAMVLIGSDAGDFRGPAAVGMFLFLSVLMISVFTFVSIAVGSEARRKEREAYYKAETMRRVAESTGDGAKYLIEMMREEERIRQERDRFGDVKRLAGLKIGAITTIAVGVGLMIFLYSAGHGSPAYLVGVIPGLIGVALAISAWLILPKPPVA